MDLNLDILGAAQPVHLPQDHPLLVLLLALRDELEVCVDRIRRHDLVGVRRELGREVIVRRLHGRRVSVGEDVVLLRRWTDVNVGRTIEVFR